MPKRTPQQTSARGPSKRRRAGASPTQPQGPTSPDTPAIAARQATGQRQRRTGRASSSQQDDQVLYNQVPQPGPSRPIVQLPEESPYLFGNNMANLAAVISTSVTEAVLTALQRGGVAPSQSQYEGQAAAGSSAAQGAANQRHDPVPRAMLSPAMNSNSSPSQDEGQAAAGSSAAQGSVVQRHDLVPRVLPATDLNHCGDVPSVYCSDVYTINPLQVASFDVYCDMDTSGGPWTVVTNRYDGSVNFYQSWNSYKNGFGTLTGEFWIGFTKYRLLQMLNLKMRIEMGGWDGSLKYVEYTSLTVSPESSYYTLSYSGFSTPHGLTNYLADHLNMPFTTYDNDNDEYEDNCADAANGAWWYDECYDVNLFGGYESGYSYTAMVWKYFYPAGGEYSSLKSTRMMLATP